MRALRVVALFVGLIAGCPTREPVEAGPAVETLSPPVRDALTRAARYELGDVTITPAEAGVIVRVDLRATWIREPRFDGLDTVGPDVIVNQADVRLVSGQQSFPMAPLAVLDNDPPDTLVLPAARPRERSWTLRFDLPGPAPDELALTLLDDAGMVTLPLRGGPRTDAGASAVIVDPVDLLGLPLAVGGRVRWSGGESARRDARTPWLVPEGVERVTVEADGFPAVEAEIPAGARIVRPVVAAADDRDRGLQAFRAAYGDLFADDGADDLAALSRRLGTPEAVAAYVRDHVAVLGTFGQQRSPEAVLRLGAGGPVERAALALALMRPLGATPWLVCGDLPLDTVRRLYATGVTVPPAPPELEARLADARVRVASLTGSLAASLAALPYRPAGAQDKYRLVPEWCWLEVPAAEKGGPRTVYDLRPAPFDRDPLPFAWRSADRLGGEGWSLEVGIAAIVRTPTGVDEVQLVAQSGPVASLDERALVLDVVPGVTPGRVRARLSWFDDVEVHAVAGEQEVVAADVDTLQLTVSWRDPAGVASRRTAIELWQTLAGPVPTLRALVSADPGIADTAQLARRLDHAVERVHAVPGVEAMAARHQLYGRLRLDLAGGAVSAWPALVVTVATAQGDGAVGWRMETLPPQPPIGLEGAPNVVAVARAAAADAIARALVLDAADPDVPTVWMRGADDLRNLPPVPMTIDVLVARSLDTLVVGASPAAPPDVADVWLLDPLTGGVSWYQGFPLSRTPDAVPVSLPPDGAVGWAHARWDASLRCAEALRWSAWAGRTAPAACQAATGLGDIPAE